MQSVLQVSRKIDYGLRAMIYLASVPPGVVTPFREIARQMGLPQDFLAKILKTLTDAGLVRSSRGAHGGYQLGRPARSISFLDVIEAVEGPVKLNVCLDAGSEGHEGCALSAGCTMMAVWRQGQERMLEVYRTTSLAELALPIEPPRNTLPVLA